MTNCFKSVLNLKNGPRDDDVWSNKTLEKKFGPNSLVSQCLSNSFSLSFSLSLSFFLFAFTFCIYLSLSVLSLCIYLFLSLYLFLILYLYFYILLSYSKSLVQAKWVWSTLWNFCNVLSFSFVKLQKQKLLIEFNAENKQNNVGWLGHCLDACSRIFLPVFKTT